jgi:hypothetical protein
MIPVPRLRLKRPAGWFAAGQEMATALPLLSDAAFKLYVFLCLYADRHSARMIWDPMEVANRLQRDRQSVIDGLEELCRREVCIRYPLVVDRSCVEIRDNFWPYEKPPVEEVGIDQNGYMQQVRRMLVSPACVRVSFSAADERLAAILYRRGVTLVQLQRTIWLGCARKYVALLNGIESAPMLVTSLHYFSALVNEVAETQAGDDYWKHIQNKVTQLETMWLERTQPGDETSQKDERRETK